ncbi:EscU/YscU/HrcU family type III secretion system export apparatus switch protein [Buchnera aphidicola]|uniref:EscU/YscU/HrcU family type III secretion system export apparatus switch protein n=1 Tax=Buchnera aphidicola TaxID=9 RepID=UPI00094D9B82|nr:EscU/YscU/HrcU family type III secretion system export apparatus switch protein [Buchnera aphidicola]
MNSESYEDKNEKPTPHKIKKSKELGILAYSHDINSFFILLFCFFFIKINWKKIIYFFYNCFLHSFIFNSNSLEDKILPFFLFFYYLKYFIFFLLFLFIGILFILIISPMVFYNHYLFINQYKFNLFFLNIFDNIKKIFSLDIFLEFFKIFLKIVFFMFITGFYLWRYYSSYILLMKLSLMSNLFLGLHFIHTFFIMIIGIIFFIAIIDFFLKHYQNYKNLQMTLQEIKNEFKELEGNPIIKQNRYHIMKKIKGKIDNIFNADVMVTDQIQYLVAIQYNVTTMSVPKVLIKSQGKSIKKMKIISKKHNIPILLLPELTKALYHNTIVRKDIPSFLYKPVAEVFAWVWQLQKWKKYGGIYPQPPKYISVPTAVYFTGE